VLSSAALLALFVAAPLSAVDLAPSLVGKAAGAPAALAAARYEEALKLLDGEVGPAGRLLAARALSHLGRHAEAVTTLAGLERALPEIADRVHYLRARELDALDRHAEAADAWGAVAPGSVLADAAAVARGRALAAVGQVDEAVRVLRLPGRIRQRLRSRRPGRSSLRSIRCWRGGRSSPVG
jgi:tetratricopeptide (TPR) repeat protein